MVSLPGEAFRPGGWVINGHHVSIEHMHLAVQAPTPRTWAVVALVMMMVAAACGSTQTVAAKTGPCPRHLVIQTDDWPTAEHGGLYRLLEPGALADGDAFAYRGPIRKLYADGAQGVLGGPGNDSPEHGIETVEIRAGGQAVGDQPAASVLATDDEIYAALVATDEVIGLAMSTPLRGVMATLDRASTALVWNSAEVPIDDDDLSGAGVPVVLPETALYARFLIMTGAIDDQLTQQTFDGTDSRWIASGGRIVQPGSITDDVYRFSRELRPRSLVDDRLLYDLGYRPYPAMVSVPVERIETDADCLGVLVPLMQRAWIDYFDDPGPVNEELVVINESYGAWRRLSTGHNNWAIAQMVQRRLVDTSPGNVFGSFDEARVEDLIAMVTKALADESEEEFELPEGYGALDVITNQFIDPSITLADPS